MTSDTEGVQPTTDDPYPLAPGSRVADREQDGKHLRVLARTPHAAEESTIAATGTTVAEENPDYPADDPVVVAAYETNLDESFGERWPEWPASYLAFMAGNYGIRTYSFPEQRLAPEPERETDSEADAEAADAGGDA